MQSGCKSWGAVPVSFGACLDCPVMLALGAKLNVCMSLVCCYFSQDQWLSLRLLDTVLILLLTVGSFLRKDSIQCAAVPCS